MSSMQSTITFYSSAQDPLPTFKVLHKTIFTLLSYQETLEHKKSFQSVVSHLDTKPHEGYN